MGSLSPIHWVIVLIIVLLLFGPGRLAGVGKGLGEGIRAFKKGLGDDAHADDDDHKQLPQTAARPAPSEKQEEPSEKRS